MPMIEGDGAFGADDVDWPPPAGQERRKLHLLMTDNNRELAVIESSGLRKQ
jgi:hypothetical protein